MGIVPIDSIEVSVECISLSAYFSYMSNNMVIDKKGILFLSI